MNTKIKKEGDMASQRAMQLAGQAWCTDKTKSKIMDAELAEAFAGILDKHLEAEEIAWGIIANASGGDWTKQSSIWKEAAARWRDNYFLKHSPVPSMEAIKDREKMLAGIHAEEYAEAANTEQAWQCAVCSMPVTKQDGVSITRFSGYEIDHVHNKCLDKFKGNNIRVANEYAAEIANRAKWYNRLFKYLSRITKKG